MHGVENEEPSWRMARRALARSVQYKFGLPSLAAAEDRKMSLGSKLLGVTLRLM